MPRDAVSRTANVERTGRHKWVKYMSVITHILQIQFLLYVNNVCVLHITIYLIYVRTIRNNMYSSNSIYIIDISHCFDLRITTRNKKYRIRVYFFIT